jgi:predicted GTPase
MKQKNVIIMGAAGRDFHNFNTCFRENPDYRVVAFTAAQIPFIDERLYPKELSGPLYPEGIPIYPEEKLAELIKQKFVDTVVFSYSDVSYDDLMHRASLVTSLDANFVLLGAERSMLHSGKPVISVCAVRTGCGKSGVTRFIAAALAKAGKNPVAIRHPMPYGDLLKARMQRFASLGDIEAARCTIEEREEYEPLVEAGVTVFAGVDYAEILEEAEKEAGVIIWDGGNNDLPFIWPDLELAIVDPLRAGDELRYHPGEANLRRADAIIINKVNSATREGINTVKRNIKAINPKARVVSTASVVKTEADISGKKVLVVEDGPTLTHGEMEFGAGTVAAREAMAHPVDVKPYAVGLIKETLEKYPHLRRILPAVGYSGEQIRDLEETINATECDLVLIATPIDLKELIQINKPTVRVRYEIQDVDSPGLKDIVAEFIKGVE